MIPVTKEEFTALADKLRPIAWTVDHQNVLDLIPEELWWEMVDAGLGHPHDLTLDWLIRAESWLYDRRYGIFPVEPAKHNTAATLLHSISTGIEWDDPAKASEEWIMNTPGTFMKSSVSQRILVGRMSVLTASEKLLLKRSGRELMVLE